MKESISVIICAHNEEKYIEKTIESYQKNKIPFELIVVCDSCSDKTEDISKKYTLNVYSVNFKNISRVRNFGAKKAKGDILVFNDADTIVSDNYLEEISSLIEGSDFGCAKWKDETGKILGKYVAYVSSNYNEKNIGGNFFVKRSFFEKISGFDEKMKRGEDTDIGDRLRKIGAKHCFMRNCFIIPSERKYKENGYLSMIIKLSFEGFLYKFFRNYYNRKIAKINIKNI